MTATLPALLFASALALAGPGSPAVHSADVQAYIHRVAPQVRPGRSWALARGIVHAGRHFGINPLLLAAIVRQESNFEPGNRVCYLVVRHHQSLPTCDYGVSQVNTVWVDHWHLDAERLVADDGYALWEGARVLAVLQREYGDEPDWFSRYNSSTPGPRQRYAEALQPWLEATAEPRR